MIKLQAQRFLNLTSYLSQSLREPRWYATLRCRHPSTSETFFLGQDSRDLHH